MGKLVLSLSLVIFCAFLHAGRTSIALGNELVDNDLDNDLGNYLGQFVVPGLEGEMELLNELHSLHHPAAFSACTLWDRWLPHATLWTSEDARRKYRNALLEKRMDRDGYVSMQQHRGMAHSEGWPFPAWQQSTGQGFHFSTDREAWAIQSFGLKPLTDTKGWQFDGADVLGIDSRRGLQLQTTASTVEITTPEFRCGTIVAPFLRLEWAVGDLPSDAQIRIQWLLEDESDWVADRYAIVDGQQVSSNMHYLNIPLHREPGYAGILQRYRIVLDLPISSRIDLKSLITAIDTRHPITNSNFLKACTQYFAWTGDVAFLGQNIDRMREALRYAVEEFAVREGKHVRVSWVGHDGRSGLEVIDSGSSQKRSRMRPGLGVGNNYWDLLPFGGQDTLATIYLYDTLGRMSELEAAIAENSNWEIPPPEALYSAPALEQLASDIQQDFQHRFWDPTVDRFVGWIDVEGTRYDYGFTFLNLEAVYYGLASRQQAKAIFAWLDGLRLIDGDTSQGADIYHWRFAPRATTRRNIETYVWAWNAPASITWGGQIQDGGAVLGFSYHDLMARLKVKGPDDAWQRLQEILAWFDEVQQAGGYRAYYADPERGTLQGGGTAGGLGLDYEFMESVLVPQVMLYGFLGFQPQASGYEVRPQLPSQWPSLTVTNIHYQDQRLNITAYSDGRVEVSQSP